MDGWSAGLTERLTVQAEYLHEVPRVTDVGTMLSGFAARIRRGSRVRWRGS